MNTIYQKRFPFPSQLLRTLLLGQAVSTTEGVCPLRLPSKQQLHCDHVTRPQSSSSSSTNPCNSLQDSRCVLGDSLLNLPMKFASHFTYVTPTNVYGYKFLSTYILCLCSETGQIWCVFLSCKTVEVSTLTTRGSMSPIITLSLPGSQIDVWAAGL